MLWQPAKCAHTQTGQCASSPDLTRKKKNIKKNKHNNVYVIFFNCLWKLLSLSLSCVFALAVVIVLKDALFASIICRLGGF